MMKSNKRITVFVTAVFLPAVRFILSSSAARASVCSFIIFSLSAPLPYCWISGSPLRLSRTKPDSCPDFVRNFIPSSPLSFETTIGIITPTVTYAANAISPRTTWKLPTNKESKEENKRAITTGEIVCA